MKLSHALSLSLSQLQWFCLHKNATYEDVQIVKYRRYIIIVRTGGARRTRFRFVLGNHTNGFSYIETKRERNANGKWGRNKNRVSRCFRFCDDLFNCYVINKTTGVVVFRGDWIQICRRCTFLPWSGCTAVFFDLLRAKKHCHRVVPPLLSYGKLTCNANCYGALKILPRLLLCNAIPV